MNSNITIIVALIAAISAIFAPFITAYINNKHQKQMKYIDMFYNEKLAAYKDFCASSSIYLDVCELNWPDEGEFDIRNIPQEEKYDYLKKYQFAYLMANKEVQILMDKLDNSNHTILASYSKKEIKLICQAMNKDLESFKYNKKSH
ncbi:hypothetical protein [Clostridium sp. HBUAS56017]|uniref:hypothetical protein n=1 Tax=Clostridium sp. HBUAS56017 TaxID=2571128 RepID=UPI0011785F40|nr:hypothetical protein [Clostridium sp. HBUAS56017]